MSQGDRFVRALQSIGCPAAKELTGESVEWIFENQKCLPFLDWLVEVIASDTAHENVLTEDELTRYDELISSGEGIIEGDKLDDALSSMRSSGLESTPIMSLKDDIEKSKQKKEALEKRLNNLIFQRNKLSLHQAKTGHQLNQINEIGKKEKQKYKNLLQKSQSVNNQMDNALNELQQTVGNITDIYAAANPDDKKPRRGFLSHLDYKDYFDSEEKYTSELTAYTKKQFFEGIADMTGKTDKTRYDLLEVSDPTSLLVRGESEQVTMNDCKELTRLKLIFIPSEIHRIQSQAKAVGLQAAVKFAKEKFMMFDHQQAADVVSLQDKVSETQSELTDVQDDIKHVAEEKLLPLIRELAELQPTKVLQGDYDLKISRQDYFISKQQQVINLLLCQRSRYEFLSMALEIEACKNRETHQLLSVVESGLKKNLTGLTTRLEKMNDPVFQLPDPRRGTIDSRDVFLGNVYKILELLSTSIPSDGQLFPMYSQILEWSSSLVEKLKSLWSAVGSTEHAQTDVLRKLEHTLQEFQKVLYGKSSKSGGCSTIGLQRLDSLVQLEDLLTSLEKSIKDVIKDIEAKKKVLRSDPLKTMERDLFICFFTDTSRLKRTLSELAARVDAQILSNTQRA